MSQSRSSKQKHRPGSPFKRKEKADDRPSVRIIASSKPSAIPATLDEAGYGATYDPTSFEQEPFFLKRNTRKLASKKNRNQRVPSEENAAKRKILNDSTNYINIKQNNKWGKHLSSASLSEGRHLADNVGSGGGTAPDRRSTTDAGGGGQTVNPVVNENQGQNETVVQGQRPPQGSTYEPGECQGIWQETEKMKRKKKKLHPPHAGNRDIDLKHHDEHVQNRGWFAHIVGMLHDVHDHLDHHVLPHELSGKPRPSTHHPHPLDGKREKKLEGEVSFQKSEEGTELLMESARSLTAASTQNAESPSVASVQSSTRGGKSNYFGIADTGGQSSARGSKDKNKNNRGDRKNPSKDVVPVESTWLLAGDADDDGPGGGGGGNSTNASSSSAGGANGRRGSQGASSGRGGGGSLSLASMGAAGSPVLSDDGTYYSPVSSGDGEPPDSGALGALSTGLGAPEVTPSEGTTSENASVVEGAAPKDLREGQQRSSISPRRTGRKSSIRDRDGKLNNGKTVELSPEELEALSGKKKFKAIAAREVAKARKKEKEDRKKEKEERKKGVKDSATKSKKEENEEDTGDDRKEEEKDKRERKKNRRDSGVQSSSGKALSSSNAPSSSSEAQLSSSNAQSSSSPKKSRPEKSSSPRKQRKRENDAVESRERMQERMVRRIEKERIRVMEGDDSNDGDPSPVRESLLRMKEAKKRERINQVMYGSMGGMGKWTEGDDDDGNDGDEDDGNASKKLGKVVDKINYVKQLGMDKIVSPAKEKLQKVFSPEKRGKNKNGSDVNGVNNANEKTPLKPYEDTITIPDRDANAESNSKNRRQSSDSSPKTNSRSPSKQRSSADIGGGSSSKKTKPKPSAIDKIFENDSLFANQKSKESLLDENLNENHFTNAGNGNVINNHGDGNGNGNGADFGPDFKNTDFTRVLDEARNRADFVRVKEEGADDSGDSESAKDSDGEKSRKSGKSSASKRSSRQKLRKALEGMRAVEKIRESSGSRRKEKKKETREGKHEKEDKKKDKKEDKKKEREEEKKDKKEKKKKDADKKDSDDEKEDSKKSKKVKRSSTREELEDTDTNEKTTTNDEGKTKDKKDKKERKKADADKDETKDSKKEGGKKSSSKSPLRKSLTVDTDSKFANAIQQQLSATQMSGVSAGTEFYNLSVSPGAQSVSAQSIGGASRSGSVGAMKMQRNGNITPGPYGKSWVSPFDGENHNVNAVRPNTPGTIQHIKQVAEEKETLEAVMQASVEKAKQEGKSPVGRVVLWDQYCQQMEELGANLNSPNRGRANVYGANLKQRDSNNQPEDEGVSPSGVPRKFSLTAHYERLQKRSITDDKQHIDKPDLLASQAKLSHRLFHDHQSELERHNEELKRRTSLTHHLDTVVAGGSGLQQGNHNDYAESMAEIARAKAEIAGMKTSISKDFVPSETENLNQIAGYQSTSSTTETETGSSSSGDNSSSSSNYRPTPTHGNLPYVEHRANLARSYHERLSIDIEQAELLADRAMSQMESQGLCSPQKKDFDFEDYQNSLHSYDGPASAKASHGEKHKTKMEVASRMSQGFTPISSIIAEGERKLGELEKK